MLYQLFKKASIKSLLIIRTVSPRKATRRSHDLRNSSKHRLKNNIFLIRASIRPISRLNQLNQTDNSIRSEHLSIYPNSRLREIPRPVVARAIFSSWRGLVRSFTLIENTAFIFNARRLLIQREFTIHPRFLFREHIGGARWITRQEYHFIWRWTHSGIHLLLINKCQWSPLHRAIGFKASSRFSSLSNPLPFPPTRPATSSSSSSSSSSSCTYTYTYTNSSPPTALTNLLYMCERWLTHPRVIVRPWTLRMARLLILHPQWTIRIFLFLFFFFFVFFSTICDNPERGGPALRFVFSALFSLLRPLISLFIAENDATLSPLVAPFASASFLVARFPTTHRLLGISVAAQSFRSRNTVLIGDFMEIRVLSVTFLPCFSSTRTMLLFSLRVKSLLWFDSFDVALRIATRKKIKTSSLV